MQSVQSEFGSGLILIVKTKAISSAFENMVAEKVIIFSGFSKMPRCKAPEVLRNEAYLDVRRNDEG